MGHLNINYRTGYLKATVVRIRVTLGHLRVTLGHLRVTIVRVITIIIRINISNHTNHNTSTNIKCLINILHSQSSAKLPVIISSCHHVIKPDDSMH